MVDIMIVLMLPGAGDDLQGLKKGVLEIADIFVVNKADGELEAAAMRGAAATRAALNILSPVSPHRRPPVLTVSAIENSGIDKLWAEVLRHDEASKISGKHLTRRQNQQVEWLNRLIEDRVLNRFNTAPRVRDALPRLQDAVARGKMIPAVAAEEILNLWEAD